MKLLAILYLTFLVTPVVCAVQRSDRPEGCVDPKIIAKVLGEMRQENSRRMSVEQFRAMWPIELVSAEADPPPSRLSFQSNDRILRGHCQCCEVFTFKVSQDRGAAPLELQGVTVNYAKRDRDTLVVMAKLFAQAVGMENADVKTVGAKHSQNYQWQKTKGDERRLYSLDLRFTRKEHLWKMYFHAAFYVVEP